MCTCDGAYTDNPKCIGDYVWIKADSTSGRRTRGAMAAAARRAYAAEHGVTLTLLARSYSESPGFLSQSSFRYRITR